ncbi:type II secretion system F family protein [Ethanoligenens sp.]|uniref:type II secretion system F family protein n=1 Tax=Ethanoligenens sp. TaxID=2099655 RepID=UPI0039EB6B1B
MGRYIFEARDMDGASIRGTQEAQSLDEFYRIVKERDLYVVDVHESYDLKKGLWFNSKISVKNLAVFCRQFSTMLESGLQVIKCLDVLYEQTQNQQLKRAIRGVYENVQHGEALSRSMEKQKGAFPPLLLNMIASGETGGTLEEAMMRMADQYEKENRMNNKVRQALTYPIFLSVITVLVVFFLLTFVMPTFMTMFTTTGTALPITTKILLGLSSFLQNSWYILAFAILILIGIVRVLMGNPAIRLWCDRRILRMPVLGKLIMTIESARFARTLASLVNGGVPIVQSIEIIEQVINNRQVKSLMAEVRKDVSRGVPLSVSIRRRESFPPMLCSMLSVGEESGNLEGVLRKTAAFYDEEADNAITRLVSMLEPLMIVIMAVIVGFIVISIITPIYSMYHQLNSTGGAGL